MLMLALFSLASEATIYPQFEIDSGDYNTLTIRTDGGSEATFQCGLGTVSKVNLAVEDDNGDCGLALSEYRACEAEKESCREHLAVCRNRMEPEPVNISCESEISAAMAEQRKTLEESYRREINSEKEKCRSLQDQNRALVMVIPTVTLLELIALLAVLFVIQKQKPEVVQNADSGRKEKQA